MTNWVPFASLAFMVATGLFGIYMALSRAGADDLRAAKDRITTVEGKLHDCEEGRETAERESLHLYQELNRVNGLVEKLRSEVDILRARDRRPEGGHAT